MILVARLSFVYIVMSCQIEIVSESLLVTPSDSSMPDSNFCLGLLDWCLCCIRKSKMYDDARVADQPQSSKSLKLKRPHVSQSIEISIEKAEESNDRFSFETTIEELESFKEIQYPENTVKNNEWALRSFESWRAARNI